MPRPMTFPRSLALSLAVLTIGLPLAACGKTDKPAAEVQAPARGVITAAFRVAPEMKPVAGEITTRDMADARARIGGTVTRLTVREGDRVRAGQVVAFITDARLGLETSAYESMVSAAAGEAARANADLGRTRSLYDKGVYAKARLDQAEAAAKAANGNLNAARARRAASAEVGAQGAIIAPSAGRVLKADVPLGSVVAAGQSVAQITAGPIVVRISLPEGQARALRVGAPVEVWPEGPGGASLTGQVTQAYPSVDAGLVTADVTVAGLSDALIGRRVTARVQVGERQALILPRRYVVTRFGIDYVRLVRSGGQVEDSPVQTAPGPLAEEIEVLSGLTAGDRIALPEASR
ncbi:Multidrug resistance protein MdtE [Caulobacter sp. NIBR1757]|nr:Multidrug resistance protein MdtE [Caulobacter sp. NIBR1757]